MAVTSIPCFFAKARRSVLPLNCSRNSGTFQGATAFPLRIYGDYIELESDGTNIWVVGSLATLDSAVLAVSQLQLLAHGIGVQPRKVEESLLNATPEHGYLAGDEATEHADSWQTGFDARYNVSKNATYIITITGANTLPIFNQSTGAPNLITPANWKFRLRYSI